MKRIPMMLQLALILFGVMAVPTAILTWYSGTQILHNSENAIAESSLAGLNANRRLAENALNNLAQDAVRLAATNIFDRIRSYGTYERLNASYGNVSSAQAVLRELVNLNHRADGVYSSYFYLAGSDYVVSTDKGITTLDRYEPTGWMEEALAERKGISGVWVPRKMASGPNVISYVLPLSRLSTTTRGTIVVNLKESQIGDYLRSSEPGEQGYYLLDSDGTVISHADKSLLLQDGREQPFIGEILENTSKEGYAFYEREGKRLLVAWSLSEPLQWRNVSIYSMDELMTQTHRLQRNIIALTAIIIFIGTLLTVVLATWLSKPVRELARTMRARSGVKIPGHNELAFLDAAFRRMQEEEDGLYKLLQERERDTRSLAIQNLLRGDAGKPAMELFSEPYYLVAVVSIDGYRRYVNHSNPETRSYHRYLFGAKCESAFPEGVYARGVYQGEGCFAVVINYRQKELGVSGGMAESFAEIGEMAQELLGHTVTIGVSSRTEAYTTLPEQLAEAMEAIKQRMIEGGGGVAFWNGEAGQSRKFIYPAHSETRILNHLDAGDLEQIISELAVIRKEIVREDYISYDNILFIYNQLAGVTLKHLRENNISTARIFAGRGNIYSALASLETLDELEDYMRLFFGEIVQYLARSSSEENYGERIIRHLEEHFREEIVFEDMAKTIGISYSYMRKIVYELTGKSLIDYMNLLRIEKAKQLLLESSLTVAQISAEVGYNNVQSFNRFFRKYEGMSPSGFKASKSRIS